MSAEFEPNLSVLLAPQRELWSEFHDVPRTFVLYRGTAVALWLGHRASVDFDFFGCEHFDPDRLYDDVTFLADSQVIQKSADTLSCLVERDGLVKVSFFGVPNIRRVRTPSIVRDNNVQIASLVDLAGMKASVVQVRAEAKDYVDIDAIVHLGGVSLTLALSAGCAIYGPKFNPQNTLKSLSYFGDGNLHTLPKDVRDRIVAAVAAVDLDDVTELKSES